MKIDRKTLFALIASILLSLALVACDTDTGADDGADYAALNDEVTALRGEVETLQSEWDTFQEEWGSFHDDWVIYREEIGLDE